MSSTNPTLTYEVTLDDVTRLARIVRTDRTTDGISRYQVELLDEDGSVARTIELDTIAPEPGVLNLMYGGRSIEAGIIPFDGGLDVDIRGLSHEMTVVDPRRKALRSGGGATSGSIKTQMPGRIVRVLVSEGDTVTKGTPLVVVEAMKMENEIKSPRDGTVTRVAIGAGDLVESRAVLVELS
jgi:acetyl/propionyl-CoA carboxylase alpha subunit